MKLNILGTEWTLERSTPEKDLALKGDGYTDSSIKRIVVDEFNYEGEADKKKDLKGSYSKQVIRHEILHAFLHESGLDGECAWATEEMVDWLALQFPKMIKTFEDAECI